MLGTCQPAGGNMLRQSGFRTHARKDLVKSKKATSGEAFQFARVWRASGEVSYSHFGSAAPSSMQSDTLHIHTQPAVAKAYRIYLRHGSRAELISGLALVFRGPAS